LDFQAVSQADECLADRLLIEETENNCIIYIKYGCLWIAGGACMNVQDAALAKMVSLLDGWEINHDPRLIFLNCYKMMTQNVLTAIEANDFEDVTWVNTLMENFAGYYFNALEAYESEQSKSPTAWRIAFAAAHNPQTHVIQNLVLGVNAHINYDLVLTLSAILAPEWQQLSAEQRQIRYRDHCRVNEIINQTIDAVQDQVIDRYDPEFRMIDKVLGPIDEWMTSLLIAEWREEVWEHVIKILGSENETDREEILALVEQTSIQRARDILGRGGLVDMIDFI
jgi:hypothetical protein